MPKLLTTAYPTKILCLTRLLIRQMQCLASRVTNNNKSL